MNEEKKETVENINKKEQESDWDGSFLDLAILMILFGFGGWGNSVDTKEHELGKHVEKLESQMDATRR